MFSKIKSLWYVLVPNDLVFFGGFIFQIARCRRFFFRGFHWFFSWPAADDFFLFTLGFQNCLLQSIFVLVFIVFSACRPQAIFLGWFSLAFQITSRRQHFHVVFNGVSDGPPRSFFSVVFIGFFKFPASGDFFRKISSVIDCGVAWFVKWPAITFLFSVSIGFSGCLPHFFFFLVAFIVF